MSRTKKGKSKIKKDVDYKPRSKVTPLTVLVEDWKERMLQEYKKGASDIEIRATVLEIGEDLWYSLIDREPEFAEIVKKGKELSKSWWLKQGRDGLFDTDETEFEEGRPVSRIIRRLNPTAYRMNMINRFDWGDSYKDLEDKRKEKREQKVEDDNWFDELKGKL